MQWTHFIKQYQKVAFFNITINIIEVFKSWEAIKFTVVNTRFTESNFYLKHEFYHWQHIMVFLWNGAHFVHCRENICRIPKSIIACQLLLNKNSVSVFLKNSPTCNSSYELIAGVLFLLINILFQYTDNCPYTYFPFPWTEY